MPPFQKGRLDGRMVQIPIFAPVDNHLMAARVKSAARRSLAAPIFQATQRNQIRRKTIPRVETDPEICDFQSGSAIHEPMIAGLFILPVTSCCTRDHIKIMILDHG